MLLGSLPIVQQGKTTGSKLLQPDAAYTACREAEFLLKLNHPSIVQCFDVVDNGKQMVLVMEYLRGGPLLDDLHHIAGESYTEQQASAIAAQVYHLHCC